MQNPEPTPEPQNPKQQNTTATPACTPAHWRLFYWLFGCTFAAVVIAFSVTPMVKAFSKPLLNKDYAIWQKYGQLGIKGQPLYPQDPANQTFEYMYPPFPAVFIYGPASLLPAPGFVFFLTLLNSASWLFVIFASVYLATGKWRGQEPLLYLIPSLICVGYAWDTYLLGQINIVLLALVLGAFILIKHKRPMTAGALIATASAIKAFPVLIVGWLLWRRQWRALAGFAVACLFILLLLPGLVRGFGQTTSELQVWFNGMAAKQSGEEIGQRSGIAFTYKNQSLKAVVHRLVRPIDAGDDEGVPYKVNFISTSPATGQALFFGAALALAVLFMLVTLPRPGPGRGLLSSEPVENISAWELSILLTLNVFASPLAWTYFYIWLLPGLTCLTYGWLKEPHGSRQRVIAAALLMVIGGLLVSAVTQAWDQHRPQAYGATFFGGLLLMLVLCAFIISRQRNTGNPTNPQGTVA